MTTSTSPSETSGRPTPAALKKAAVGKWHFIFEDLAPQLAEALASAPEHVSCPHHGGSDGYRFFDHYNETGRSVCNTCGPMRSGLDTLMLATGWQLDQACRELADWLEKDSSAVREIVREAPVVRPKVEPAVAYRRIREVWQASTPIAGTPAEKYLEHRGIWRENIPSSLRAHAGLAYVHGKQREYLGKFPCLLAPVRAVDRSLVTIHRYFLTPEGLKADVPDVKKMMSQWKELSGASIQLFPAEETLGVAEGIETALAAHAVSRMPVWAAANAVMLEQIEVPPCVKRLVIWADHDWSERGIQAAVVLAARMEAKGLQVEIYLPYMDIPSDKKGVDWLDVMMTQGVNGFPAKWRRWRPLGAITA